MIDVFGEDDPSFNPFVEGEPFGDGVIYTSNDVLYTLLKYMIKGKHPGFSDTFASYVKEHEDIFVGFDELGNLQYSNSSPIVLILSNIVRIIDVFPPCIAASIAANRFINIIDSLKAFFANDMFDSFLKSKVVNERIRKVEYLKSTISEEEIMNNFLNKIGRLQDIDFSNPDINFDLSEGFIRLNFLDTDKEYYTFNFQ